MCTCRRRPPPRRRCHARTLLLLSPTTTPTSRPPSRYTVDVEVPSKLARKLGTRLKPKQGSIDRPPSLKKADKRAAPTVLPAPLSVVVVGAGPAGLFAALELVRSGAAVTIVERGQPVEKRGKDIGQLMNRRKILDGDSNFCYGEGGAGTWSDGKLTTRVGGSRAADVRSVLETMVDNGAPDRILVDSKPHLGTDRLISILKSLRQQLMEAGATFAFGRRVLSLEMKDGRAVGVNLAPEGVGQSNFETIPADSVVMAPGHSARELIESLADSGVPLLPKTFAVGLRVEHPQELINEIQCVGAAAARDLLRCCYATRSCCRCRTPLDPLPRYKKFADNVAPKGKLPVADYTCKTEVPDESMNGDSERGKRPVYSFCMCPGGQVVPTSVRADELCVNGMSFSRRNSKWANSALVAYVSEAELAPFAAEGALAGVAFQRQCEQRAAVLGGGDLVAPVQRVTDYLAGVDLPEGATLPSSSYRLGVKAARLDEGLFPDKVTEAIKAALLTFDKQMPGFITDQALLHGVETRTSSPVQIKRNRDTLECDEVKGLFPTGEGAGQAGGIVSAAVDGMRVGRAAALAAVPRI